MQIFFGCSFQDQNGLYPAMYRMENVPESSGALLDSNHSHFLLVDNGTEEKYGVEIDLRSKFEEAVMKVKTDSRSAAGTKACEKKIKNVNLSKNVRITILSFCVYFSQSPKCILSFCYITFLQILLINTSSFAVTD